MKKINLIRGAKFELLAQLTNKKKHTIQVFFSRNNMDIEKPEDVKKYLEKNLQFNLK